jgi:preprotein translocase subunit Sec61beta
MTERPSQKGGKMKNKTTTMISIVVVLVTVLCITGPAEAGPPARPNLQGGAPTVVSYQGQVIADGSPYNSIGYFMFAIVDADENIYWTNDGQEPAAGVPLTVTDGLFNVLLGDTDLPNMTTLPAGAFDEPERYLRTWFSTDGSDYLLLAPDQRIAAVPYALQAQEAVDADTLDGEHASAFADAAHIHVPNNIAPQGAGSGLDADLLDGQHGSYYQARVSGACAVGSTVRAINPDGTVVCQVDAPLNRAIIPTANVSTTLDSALGDAGRTSVTIGADGLGFISYYDFTNRDLKVAHCNDIACTSATPTTLDSTGDVGRHTSVTVGSDGLGLISYYDFTNGDLKVAHCNDIACTSASLTTLDSTGNVGWDTSVTIGADGLGLISYYDFTNGDLKVAHCNDVACTSASLTTLDSTGNVGRKTSATIGADRLPLISYIGTGDLKVAHCNDIACASATLATLDSNGWDTSVTIGADRLGLISYYDSYNSKLKVAHCDDSACTSATLTTLDDARDYGTSVTISADGLGLISYYDEATDATLKVAHCNDLACTSATLTMLDSAGYVGWYTSVTIGVDGLPLISYYDASIGNLKVFHCGNSFCVDYFRRR